MVREGYAGEVVTASLSRLQCEMYPLMNRVRGRAKAAGNSQELYARLLALHAPDEQNLLAKRFGRRLTALGWIHNEARTTYCFRMRFNDK